MNYLDSISFTIPKNPDLWSNAFDEDDEGKFKVKTIQPEQFRNHRYRFLSFPTDHRLHGGDYEVLRYLTVALFMTSDQVIWREAEAKLEYSHKMNNVYY